jgi:hypothetical protein
MFEYGSLFVLQFLLGVDQSAHGLCWLMFLGVEHGVWCSPVCSVIDTQAVLEPLSVTVAGRNGAKFSQCYMGWEGFPQGKGSGC